MSVVGLAAAVVVTLMPWSNHKQSPPVDGKVVLTTEPMDVSEVRLDDHVIDSRTLAEAGVTVRQGQHQITVRASCYQSWTSAVNVTAGSTSTVRATLQPVDAEVQFVLNPPDATVAIDGGRVPYLPNHPAHLAAGDYFVLVFREGFRTVSRNIHVACNTSPQTESFTLLRY